MLNIDIAAKLKLLEDSLLNMEAVLVAYSGGVDSSLLLKVASSTSIKVLAVTAASPIHPECETQAAKILARGMGVPHLVITTDIIQNINFYTNPPDRCYFCKKELIANLKKLVAEYNLKEIVDGTNAEDAGDFRPGTRAAREYGVRSPLQEAGLTKNEIRQLAKYLGLPNWNKPAKACLASRIPYGEIITPAKIKQVKSAENYLHHLGLKEVRVRHHGTIARLEVNPKCFPLLTEASVRKGLVNYFHSLGFTYIALDLEGFRSGSLNAVLDTK